MESALYCIYALFCIRNFTRSLRSLFSFGIRHKYLTRALFMKYSILHVLSKRMFDVVVRSKNDHYMTIQ